MVKDSKDEVRKELVGTCVEEAGGRIYRQADILLQCGCSLEKLQQGSSPGAATTLLHVALLRPPLALSASGWT